MRTSQKNRGVGMRGLCAAALLLAGPVGCGGAPVDEGTSGTARESVRITLPSPTAADPDAERARGEPVPSANEAFLPRDGAAIVGDVLAAASELRSVLEAAQYPESQQVDALLVRMSAALAGAGDLPESELCLARRGLPALLDRVRPGDPHVARAADRTRGALDVLCAGDAALPSPGPGGVGGVDEGDAGDTLLSYCATVGVRPPDLVDAKPFFEFEGFQLSLQNATVTLEEGQKLAVATTCPKQSNGDVTTQYGVKLELTYTSLDPDFFFEQTRVLGNFITGGNATGLPADLDLHAPALLRWRTVRQVCGDSCTYEALGPWKERSLAFVELGAMCKLGYRWTTFTLNDRLATKGEWYSASVDDLDVAGVLAAWEPELRAYARTSAQTGTDPVGAPIYESSYPDYNEISGSQYFVVHSTDHLNIYDALVEDGIPRLKLIREMGTTELSGLRFPRIVGNNFVTGELYSYTCTPPHIVRDAVALCQDKGDAADSYYQLPYLGSHYTFQGNNGSWSHQGQWAYDFEGFMSAVADKVLAARAGRVIKVVRDKSQSCPNGGCAPNKVIIKHQDGTMATYLHFGYETVTVMEKQNVPRGEYIGVMGMTGWAAADHVHFQTDELALFDDASDACVEPKGPLDNRTSTFSAGQSATLRYILHPELGLPFKR